MHGRATARYGPRCRTLPAPVDVAGPELNEPQSGSLFENLRIELKLVLWPGSSENFSLHSNRSGVYG